MAIEKQINEVKLHDYYNIYIIKIARDLCFRPDGVGTVTHEEKEKFQEIKDRLRILLENQITNFR